MDNIKKPAIDWNERIRQYRESGLSLKKWCNSTGVSYYSMKNHIYKTGKVSSEKTADESPESVQFIPVTVDRQIHSDSSVRLSIRNDISISIDHDTNLDLVRKIIEALL